MLNGAKAFRVAKEWLATGQRFAFSSIRIILGSAVGAGCLDFVHGQKSYHVVLTRFPDWTSRLESFLRESADRKFKYGQMDCGLFVADAILSMTGTDIAEPYRNRYSSRAEALSLASEIADAKSIEAIATERSAAHGMTEVPFLRANRGDMILLRRPRDFSLGILGLDGRGVLIAAAIGWGVAKSPVPVRAWRV